ncbi:MAG: hypothetical protein IPM23_14625 [Candidatus Melainabacteria bacterium]|nr:hypothetical protein [Candidatus Melainabacteria bacterium]
MTSNPPASTGKTASTPEESRDRDRDRDRDKERDKDRNWIAEVSHELRLPIANIKLLVETLLDGALEDRETCQSMLNRTRQEVERLESLVKDLLSIEQVSQPRQDINRKAVLLADAALYALESVSDLAARKGIGLISEIEEDYKVFANPDQLNQVVLNLVENAVKYTGEGGKVWIRSGTGPGCLEVADNGIGIPRQEIPKIFNRFYRVDRTRLRGSTGLGLSIVKHIADLHGAKISVTSEEGSGSTFRLEFPGSELQV